MTDEEKIKKARDILCHDCRWNGCDNDACPTLRETVKAIELGLAEGRKEKCLEQNNDGTIRPCEVMKDNEELKKEISVLLSCSNCPENKGGYICEKEYNNKCLAQKIEYIKELKEQIEKMKCCGNCKYCCLWEDFYINMTCSLPNTNINLGNKCDKWELAE